MTPSPSDPTTIGDVSISVAAAAQARPRAELEREIMDSNIPKNDREWWAADTIARLRERVAELEYVESINSVLRQDSVQVAAELSSLKAAGTRADGIEEAAKVAEEYDGEGLSPGVGYHAQLGDGFRTKLDIAEAIRALSPAPEAKPVAAIEELRSHQIQLDQDGIQVGVSRQALEEVLSFIEGKC